MPLLCTASPSIACHDSKMPTALVTGASSGIGYAFAERFAARGDDLIMVARGAERLEAAAQRLRDTHAVRCRVVVADLAQRDGIQRVIEAARDCDDLRSVVANAGTTRAARAGSMPADDIDGLMELLAIGVIQLIESVVGSFVRRGSGDIVIVSSVAALIPMPKSAIYASAKAAATSYARSLHRELRPTGVRVTAVNPGYVRTGLHDAAGLGHLSAQIPSWLWIDPERVVADAERALRRSRASTVPGALYRVSMPFLASAPAQALWARLTRRRGGHR